MRSMVTFLIVCLVAIDAFFITYAVGLNIRKVKIVDASLSTKVVAPATPAQTN